MISVLFARRDSVYKTLDVDVWDADRDARLWPGGNPCVAHPPCRAWGMLSHFAKPRIDEKELAITAIGFVRAQGGVLEHPNKSKLWKHLNLPTGMNRDEWGGYTLSVNQSWWGHKAEKKTWLYIVGCKSTDLPPITMSFDAITHKIGFAKSWKGKSRYGIKEVSKKEREATPIDFAKWLIEVAKKCKP
jgi:hypothetical protein